MGARPKFRRLHSHTYLAMMAIKGETNRFMYFEAGSYALLNLQKHKKIRRMILKITVIQTRQKTR